ncbi:MAG: GIY-YIG nuclease family protein [Candidatus Anammoxibacter sp.]
MANTYYVYMLASKRNGTLYLGVTNNLERRMYEHKNSLVEGFSKKYKVYNLVYYEETNDIHAALEREKQLKKWNRKWKLALIERANPNWNDIAKDWIPAKSMRE